MFDNVTMNDLLVGFNNKRIESKKSQKWGGTKYTMNRVKNGHVNSNKAVDHKKREKRVKPTTYKMWNKASNEWQELKCSEKTYKKLKKMGEKVERDGSQDTFIDQAYTQRNKAC